MKIEAIKSKDSHTYWIEQGDTLYKGRLASGQYQSTNWTFAQTLIPKWRRCIDIGSNNAVNAIHYAKKFETVECFEPTPLAQQLWTRTIRDNDVNNCILHTNALGETVRTTEIITHPCNGGHNHIQHFDKNPRSRGTTKKTIQVDVRTLDSYNFNAVDFIKIDVEGYEYFVLQGAEQTIQRERPLLQLEIVGKQCRRFNYSAENMIDWIKTFNYRVASKRDGWLNGTFKTHNGDLLYDGIKRKGDMDLFFIPNEWNVDLYTSKFGEMFEVK